MPEMARPRELFLHELRDIYCVEQMLPKLAGEATDAELECGFQQHQRQTERHVENVEAAFRELGARATGEDCPGFDGLKEEHDEIAAYTGLVAMTRGRGLGREGAKEERRAAPRRAGSSARRGTRPSSSRSSGRTSRQRSTSRR